MKLLNPLNLAPRVRPPTAAHQRLRDVEALMREAITALESEGERFLRLRA